MNPQETSDILNGIDNLLDTAEFTHDTKMAIGSIIIAINNLKQVVAQLLEIVAQHEQPVHGDIQVSAQLGELHSAAGGCEDSTHASHNANEPAGKDTSRRA